MQTKSILSVNSDCLDAASIKVSFTINLDSASVELNPKVAKAIEEYSSVKGEFYVPRPEYYRGIGDSEDEVVVTRQTDELEQWIDNRFVDALMPGVSRKIANQAISHVRWFFPKEKLESERFLELARPVVLLLMIDCAMDDKDLLRTQQMDKSSMQNCLKCFTYMSEMLVQKKLGNGENEDDGDNNKMEIWMKIQQDPWAAMLIGAMLDVPLIGVGMGFGGMDDSREDDNIVSADLSKDVSSFIEIVEALEAQKMIDPEMYGRLSDDTLRDFRNAEFGMKLVVRMFILADKLNIPDRVWNHPLFKRYIDVFAHINAMTNDILGLQKDLKNGEDTGMLFRKLMSGQSLQEVLNSELERLNVYFKDLLTLRDVAASYFSEYKDVKILLDHVALGCLAYCQVFSTSDLYGMRENIHLDM